MRRPKAIHTLTVVGITSDRRELGYAVICVLDYTPWPPAGSHERGATPPPPPDSCGSEHRGGLAKAFYAAVVGPRSFRGAVAATPERSAGSAVMAIHLAVF